MTVYKAIKHEAEAAAQIAVALAKGDRPPSRLFNQQTDNGSKRVPSVILTPVAVTRGNVKDTIVKDGFWTTFQICVGRYAATCHRAGLL